MCPGYNIWWWGFSFRALEYVKSPFNCHYYQVHSALFRELSISQIDLFEIMFKRILNYLKTFLAQLIIVIGLYINSDKTEFTCQKQNEAISTLNVKIQKLVDQFTYLGSNISSTENNVNICIGKAWTNFNRLSIILK